MSILLNLDTLVVRPKIAIDGKPYEILSPDELPVLTSHLLGTKGRRMDELMAKPELTPVEAEELKGIVVAISDTIMEPVPAAVRAKLTDPQRDAVVGAFSTLLQSKKAGTAVANLKRMVEAAVPTMGKPRTGAKTSPASSASTAARRGGGSPKRRSRS